VLLHPGVYAAQCAGLVKVVDLARQVPVALNYLPSLPRAHVEATLRVTPLHLPRPRAAIPLVLEVEDERDSLRVLFNYSASFFERTTIERFVSLLDGILQSAANDADPA
jgi:hypothetical protein